MSAHLLPHLASLRDRGKEYVLGATLGAPGAAQIADRWHVLKNRGDTLKALFTQHQD